MDMYIDDLMNFEISWVRISSTGRPMLWKEEKTCNYLDIFPVIVLNDVNFLNYIWRNLLIILAVLKSP